MRRKIRQWWWRNRLYNKPWDRAKAIAEGKYTHGPVFIYPRGGAPNLPTFRPDRMHIVYYTTTNRVIDVHFG